MKRFGFHPDQLYYNLRNPIKVRYINTKKFGDIEVPMKASKSWNIHDLAENYQKRLEWQQYMCPGGLKPTITSRFPKPATEIDFVSHTMLLSRSDKKYDNNTVSFRCNDFLSKPEIRQYL